MNQFSAKTNWATLCKMSLTLTNSRGDEQFHPDLVYMAENSIGSRTIHAGEPIDRIDHGYGDWCGYQENDAKSFTWGSRSSKADIHAQRVGGEWILVFGGSDTSERDESSYIVSFALAAKLETVEVINLDNAAALRAPLSNIVETWFEAKGFSQVGEKLARFLTKVTG